MSLRARLTLFTAAGIALVLGVGSVATYLIVRGQVRGQVDSSLRRFSARGVVVLADAPAGQLPDVLRRFQRRLPPPGSDRPAGGIRIAAPLPFGSAPLYLQLIDRSGRVQLRGDHRVTLPVAAGAVDVVHRTRPSFLYDATVKGAHLRVFAAPLDAGHAVLVALPLTEVDRALDRLLVTLLLITGGGIALAALVGGGIAHGALRPVRRLTDTAEAVADTHDLGTRIGEDRRDELGRLGASFDKMLGALDDALAAQRRLVADASHELRTPLTTLRTNIEVLREGEGLADVDRARLVDDLAGEVEELTGLVADVVDLARGSQREFHLVEVRLDALADDVVGRARSRYPDVRFRLVAEPSVVLADADRLERALSNLVDNAAKWSPPRSEVEILVRRGEISVRDHGPGVAEADRPFIFERFYRAGEARRLPGSGLGLAIVSQVAETHGGAVDVEPAEGGGSRFRLSLVEATGT
jgi:two-component system sensor histidine kinase MprB